MDVEGTEEKTFLAAPKWRHHNPDYS